MNSKGKLNEWKIIGNVGRDAEVITLDNGHLIVKFSMATVQGFKDEDALWTNVEMFVNPQTPFGKYQLDTAGAVKKGDYVFVSGHVKMHSYTKKDGSKGTDLANSADSIMVLRKKDGDVRSDRPMPVNTSANIPEELGGNDGFETEEGPLF